MMLVVSSVDFLVEKASQRVPEREEGQAHASPSVPMQSSLHQRTGHTSRSELLSYSAKLTLH